jgi:hypothetical protein
MPRCMIAVNARATYGHIHLHITTITTGPQSETHAGERYVGDENVVARIVAAAMQRNWSIGRQHHRKLNSLLSVYTKKKDSCILSE